MIGDTVLGNPCALAIGNFDGVHLGHQELLRQTVRYAHDHSLIPATLTFHPHPTVVVAPDRVPLLICSIEERVRLLKATGIEQVFVLDFNHEVAALSPRDFVARFLAERFCVRASFVGDQFRFGYRKLGTPDTLRALAQEFHFVPHFLSPVIWRGDIVSSSAIRQQLTNGQVNHANHLLGRFFTLAGIVVTGHGIGSKQTVPTLNLKPSADRIIPRGVYVTKTLEPATGRHWRSITNCGIRPTFAGNELTVETFLLDPLEGSSPENIAVGFYHFIRPEMHFPDAQTLKAQILKDAARAQAYWRHFATLVKPAP